MKEESRRRIARLFLEDTFGKYGYINVDVYGKTYSFPKAFELYRSWDSMDKKSEYNEARAFEVMYSPYHSKAEHRMIAVSDNDKELKDIVNQCFEKKDVKYEEYKGYKIAYD